MGKLIPLLIKELKLISRRPTVLFLLILLPVFFGLVFSSYTSAIPRDTPVAIVIDEKLPPVTVKEIMVIASTFSHPHLVSDLPRALSGLQREDYYVVIEIKRYESFTNASYVVYYDDSMTPVASVSSDLLELLRARLGGTDIEEHPVNEHVSLPEFFFPGVLLLLAVIVGFEVVSDNTLEEGTALPRLRAFSSLSLNFTIRIAVAILVMLFQAVLTKLLRVNRYQRGVQLGSRCRARAVNSLPFPHWFGNSFPLPIPEARKELSPDAGGVFDIHLRLLLPSGILPSFPPKACPSNSHVLFQRYAQGVHV
nr:ABC transporter permease [Thermococcus sp. Bubb.Bath]